MRRDKLDLALLQSRLLIHDVVHQFVGREDASVRRQPIILEAPFAQKNPCDRREQQRSPLGLFQPHPDNFGKIAEGKFSGV